MISEKDELVKLRKKIDGLISQAVIMQRNEAAFVINDRLHDKFEDSSLLEWLSYEFEVVLLEIDNRILELN